MLYATRELGISPATLGSIYAVGSLGGLLGSLVAERLAKWQGLGWVIVGAQILVSLAVLAILLSGRQFWIAVPLIFIAEALWGFAAVVHVVNLSNTIEVSRFCGRPSPRPVGRWLHTRTRHPPLYHLIGDKTINPFAL
jgi:predicted MFS family arabinose efflux permease